MREAIYAALAGFGGGGSAGEKAGALFGALGYRSDRTADLGGVEEFLAVVEEKRPLTDRQRALFEAWHSAEIVFQITEDDIGENPTLFQEFEPGRAESFLFVAADLKEPRYTRTELAEMTRAVNRGFEMPVILLFRHGASLTLAAIHRRAHKRDGNRDVLEKVTLVKDIRTGNPHRAQVEILADLALSAMRDAGVRSFDSLHIEWEHVLDIEELNRRFYRKLFGWFERARAACRFPDDGAGDGSDERHVIRLITRLLFVWFMKEKGLIPGRLFGEEFASEALKEHAPDGTNYYRAVLQNLFFATLNTEIDKRAFSKENNATHRDFTKYRYRDLLADPDGLMKEMERVPFVNGGLFDCLDDFAATGQGGRRIDVFTDNKSHRRGLEVPAHLFFDPDHGLFTLFRDYKFTVEENTPLDREVALDPELLGRAFENLLAAYNPETRETARKATGSYYTPRQVVDYMVQEALTEALAAKSEPADGDAKWWRDRLQYLLDHSVAMDDANEFFDENERRAVVAAIADVKALDPAVGSGAFPMGILQTLTLALRRIDPDNRLWEEFQKDRARSRAGEAFDTEDQKQRDETLREISATFQKYRHTDFGRKLYLIQNSIYGVDIQPIACQIAKLRFFISLVIEQNQTAGLPNLGIEPLPNLETKIVAADTLIGLQAETEFLLLDDMVVEKRKQITASRERYFLADSRRKKLECIESEQSLRGELYKVLENERRKWIAAQKLDIEEKLKRLSNPVTREKLRQEELRKFKLRQTEYDESLSDAQKVAKWDPYNQNNRSDWFEPEHMFGISDGFDIVLGNPPYVESRNSLMSVETKILYGNQVYSDWDAKVPRGSDLLIYFFTRGAKLLNSRGIGCFITQNAWLSTDYGLAFQSLARDRISFSRIVDSSAKFFSNPEGPNINAVIASFNKSIGASIEFGIADDNMMLHKRKIVKLKPNIKWGHLFSMPKFFEKLLDSTSELQDSENAVDIKFGQGINVPKTNLSGPDGSVGIIAKDPQFVAGLPKFSLSAREISKRRLGNPPALILPRGVGDRHYCTFNLYKAHSLSAVELYLPEKLWESNLHYCLWAYMNSSFVWLYREITGRKNLGGGMLKAEATDMKGLPIAFKFDFGDSAKEIFHVIKEREPLPLFQEVFTDEHEYIDNIVGRFFGFTDSLEKIRNDLLEQVHLRISRAKKRY